jgi:hypothetical protein
MNLENTLSERSVSFHLDVESKKSNSEKQSRTVVARGRMRRQGDLGNVCQRAQMASGKKTHSGDPIYHIGGDGRVH